MGKVRPSAERNLAAALVCLAVIVALVAVAQLGELYSWVSRTTPAPPSPARIPIAELVDGDEDGQQQQSGAPELNF